MTKDERQQSLANARLACELLTGQIDSFFGSYGDKVKCLIAEFCRLDTGEQKRNEAGRKFGKLGAKHGKKGGRPRKETK